MNILLIPLIPLRVNHVSCYGYERPTTPNIDRIAAQGTVFERAYATATNTGPGYASVLTGLYPSAHGVTQERVLDEQIPTMAALLADCGYRTAAFVNHPHVGRYKGLHRGFEKFHEMWRIWRTDQAHEAAGTAALVQ